MPLGEKKRSIFELMSSLGYSSSHDSVEIKDDEILRLFKSYNNMNKIFNILRMINPDENIDITMLKAQRLDRFLSLIKTAIFYSKYLLEQEGNSLGVIKYVVEVILKESRWKEDSKRTKDPLAIFLILDDARLEDFVNVLIELNDVLSQEYISKKRLKDVVALINKFETLYNSYVYGSK
jgi:hypothetical protein